MCHLWKNNFLYYNFQKKSNIFKSKFLLTFYLGVAILYEHFREKLCWADKDYEELNFFQALKLLTIWSKKPLLRSCKQTFAAVCLLQLEFLLWKNFFDMVPRFDQTQLEKTHITIVFYNIHLKVKPQNRDWFNLIFLNCFLSPYGVMTPKILFFVRHRRFITLA